MKAQNLKELYVEFAKIFLPEVYYDSDGKSYGTYPFYLDKENENYEGYEAIIVGDDTEISEYGAGLFKVLDYHQEEEIEILNSEEVIDYYLGMSLAYQVPIIQQKSLAFRKGYKKILSQVATLVDITKEDSEPFNPNNN